MEIGLVAKDASTKVLTVNINPLQCERDAEAMQKGQDRVRMVLAGVPGGSVITLLWKG